MAYNETPTKGYVMKKTLDSTKNFVRRNKVVIAVIATAAPLIALNIRNVAFAHKVFQEYETELGKYVAKED
jgi:hypothetical protein